MENLTLVTLREKKDSILQSLSDLNVNLFNATKQEFVEDSIIVPVTNNVIKWIGI